MKEDTKSLIFTAVVLVFIVGGFILVGNKVLKTSGAIK